ncbi:MAG: DUF349 domain-containing protein, partial [Bacteroidetes bacterium]|nr:DUF349 domain-containing protein [Bacteroidota bacterium]
MEDTSRPLREENDRLPAPEEEPGIHTEEINSITAQPVSPQENPVPADKDPTEDKVETAVVEGMSEGTEETGDIDSCVPGKDLSGTSASDEEPAPNPETDVITMEVAESPTAVPEDTPEQQSVCSDEYNNLNEDIDDDAPTEDDEGEGTDYSAYTKQELIAHLVQLLEKGNIANIRSDVENIKLYFYKKLKQETENKRKAFVNEGGEIHDFRPEPDPSEGEFKELLKKYRELKADFAEKMELEKQDNLKKKIEVIEAIRDLINRKEAINKTFQEFRELQEKWREIGQVPQAEMKDLWENYHLHVENFY